MSINIPFNPLRPAREVIIPPCIRPEKSVPIDEAVANCLASVLERQNSISIAYDRCPLSELGVFIPTPQDILLISVKRYQ